MKTIDNIKEKYLAIVTAIITATVCFKYNIGAFLDMEKFVDKAVDVSSISFGFLLAVLALLLQTNTDKINIIKQSGRFSELINFNKKAVIASAITAILALVYVGLKLYENSAVINFHPNTAIKTVADTIFFACFAYQIVLVYLFLDLFYFIIK